MAEPRPPQHDEHELPGAAADLLALPAVWSDPPPELRDEVLDPDPFDEEAFGEPVRKRTSGRRRAVAVVAAIALFALGIGTGTRLIRETGDTSGGGGTAAPSDLPGGVRTVELAATGLQPGARGSLTVEDRPDGVSLRLRVEGLDPAPPGTYYQGWVWGPAGAVSIGTFHARGRSDAPIWLWSGVDLAAYPRLTITLQDEGGGPAPTDRRVLTGSL